MIIGRPSVAAQPAPASVGSVPSVGSASPPHWPAGWVLDGPPLPTRNQEPGTRSAPLPRPCEPKIKLPAGTASKKLKDHQKRELSDLAEVAFKRAELAYDTDDLKLAAWRQRESIKAAGVRISEAEQKHYNDLKAHFQVMAGESGKAFDTTLREHTSPARVARFKLNEELTRHGLAESYASTIARCKFKQSVLDKLTAKQLWSLVYDIRRSHTKKAKAAREQAKGTPSQP